VPQLCILTLVLLTAEPLAASDHFRKLEVDGQERSYYIHVPPQYDVAKRAPVVLAFHGAQTNAPIMALSSGLTLKSDKAGFILVYPNGTGKGKMLLVWNSGSFRGPNAKNLPDDVAFVEQLLDDLATVVSVDPKRVYATGMSNGAMMCYRLAAELSDRIAAIAPVSGTMSAGRIRLKRPVPVIHFHGTEDKFVPFEGPDKTMSQLVTFKSVNETVRTWARLNGCPKTAESNEVPDTADDGTTVKRLVYGPGRHGAEVILYVIDGGGHTWPGRIFPVPFLGNTTRDISANDLMWEFFEKHPMK